MLCSPILFLFSSNNYPLPAPTLSSLPVLSLALIPSGSIPQQGSGQLGLGSQVPASPCRQEQLTP